MPETPTRVALTAGDAVVSTLPGELSGGRLPPPPVGTGRYALHDEIARGGMGEVYRATDASLGREVAVKVLQFRFALDAAAERRFADEARITGRLQHPNIPAVHDLGTLPDGRPFLAMKLIGGRTLADILAGGSAVRGSLVAAFEQVCHAVAFAHSRRVIHRDLKPANVMVGNFGEVQVMDWGLAKQLRGADEAREEDSDPPHAPHSDDTVTGSVLGTLAYMPPEQAIGAVGRVDERSDVFGLGAILCAILTGQPPYVGTGEASTRELATAAKLGACFARLDACGADPDLVSLCRRCLSPDPAARPANAGEVAGAVAAHLSAAAERARRAELDRARAEAEVRAQRKKRLWQLALAGALALLVSGGVGVAWWRDREAAKLRTERADWIGRCEAAVTAGAAGPAAEALADVERRLPEGGAEEFADRIARCRADLALLRDLDAADQRQWNPVAGRLPDARDVAARQRAVLAEAGLTPAAADVTGARVADSLLKARLLLVFDLWLLSEPDHGVRAVLRVADPDAYRDEVRDAILAGDSERVADLADRPAALTQPPWFATALGRNSAVPAARRRGILEAAHRAWPGDLNLLLVLGHNFPDGRGDGVRWLQAAAAVHPRSPVARLFLGSALFVRGDLDGAIEEYRAARDLDPASPTVRGLLGDALRRLGDRDEAVAECREAVRLDGANPANHFLLGLALRDRGDLAEAAASLGKAEGLAPTHLPYSAAVQQVERWRGLVPKLATVAAGPIEPKRPLEALEFVSLAHVCRQPFQRKYLLATRLYAAAFGGKFASAKFLAEGSRYDAACSAVLAATGADAEWTAVGVEEWGLLTDLAHQWLSADYRALAAKSADPKAWPEVADAFAEWKRTPELAPVRDPARLAAMPPADRKRWADFWATVDAGLAWVSRPAPE